MKINVLDKGFVELQDIMGNDLAIVNAARVSYLGESKGEVADKKLLLYLMEHNHTSPFEQVEFKFHVKAPLFVTRQWMRHRTWNYNETSRRYTEKNIDFYFPDNWRTQSENNKQASGDNMDEDNNLFLKTVFENSVNSSLKLYNDMLTLGVSREMARMILPQNVYTEFIAKTDAHNLMHFFKLRLHKNAQYEIQLYAQAMFDIFKEKLPWTAEGMSI